MSTTESRVLLPKRSRKFGVGKEIGGNVYLHRIYEQLLEKDLQKGKVHLPPDFSYSVVKLNLKTQAVTFTHSPDFDIADEPIVGMQILVRDDGSTSMHKLLDDPYIYHHKWLFVADDYGGFDVDESRKRSLAWMSLPDVDKSLIGRASYWNQHVVPRLSKPADDAWLRSEEVRKRLKLTTCELAHKRDAGHIRFKKVGNAYLYQIDENAGDGSQKGDKGGGRKGTHHNSGLRW